MTSFVKSFQYINRISTSTDWPFLETKWLFGLKETRSLHNSGYIDFIIDFYGGALYLMMMIIVMMMVMMLIVAQVMHIDASKNH